MLLEQYRKDLDCIVNKIESHFPGTTAAYEGTVNQRYFGADDEIVMQVYNVLSAQWQSFRDFVFKLTSEFEDANPAQLTVLGWTEKETKAHLLLDVESVKKLKQLRVLEKRVA